MTAIRASGRSWGRLPPELSDLAIVTSDNPRTEDPSAILAQIRSGIVPLGLREYLPEELSAGFVEKGFVICESRREAIRLAAVVARPGDIVLLAGKGHEDYQIIGTVKHHFDDREEGAAAFRESESTCFERHKDAGKVKTVYVLNIKKIYRFYSCFVVKIRG